MTTRLRLADPAPTARLEASQQPNYFEVEVRLFQVGVNLAARSGFFSSTFPLTGAGSVHVPVVLDEEEPEAEIAGAQPAS